MADGFDLKEFSDFDKKLLKIANDKMPKESKKFLRNEGTKLKNKTLKNAKEKVQKDTGNYHKSIKRGKVYKYDGSLSIRAYSSAPHAHLLEFGHIQVDSEGNEHGFVEGKHIFEDTKKEFENKYYDDCQKFIDNMLKKGL